MVLFLESNNNIFNFQFIQDVHKSTSHLSSFDMMYFCVETWLRFGSCASSLVWSLNHWGGHSRFTIEASEAPWAAVKKTHWVYHQMSPLLRSGQAIGKDLLTPHSSYLPHYRTKYSVGLLICPTNRSPDIGHHLFVILSFFYNECCHGIMCLKSSHAAFVNWYWSYRVMACYHMVYDAPKVVAKPHMCRDLKDHKEPSARNPFMGWLE